MIHSRTFSNEWLRTIVDGFSRRADPKLLEKVVRALSLLEQLQIRGLEFVFKGGTSLILHFEQPRRFSIDIDIVMGNRPENLTATFEAIVAEGVFNSWVDDSERASHPDIPVGHYKFYYTSEVDPQHPEEPILLDILYAKPHYQVIIEKPVQHPWIITDGTIPLVRMPDTDSLLGDKLTAFAPNTTGILYTKERPTEIVKQLFDVAQLFDAATDIAVIQHTFEKMAEQEIAFRQLPIGTQEVLDDSFETALVIARRDNKDAHFKQLENGIQRLSSFVIGGYTVEGAVIAGSKVAYLSQLLKKGNAAFSRYAGPKQISDWQIRDPVFNRLNKLKKSQPEAFFYWYQALALLTN